MFRRSRLSVTAWIAVVAVIGGLSYVLTGGAMPPASAQSQAPEAVVEYSPDGKLKQPVGYRKWVYVGTPVTPKDMNGDDDSISEFHAVYIDPESFPHYEKTGEFRDGAVMLKEFIDVGAKEAVSGNGYFMGEYTGLEVSVKDSKRFKDEPGNWAFFTFGHHYPLKEEATKQNAAACNACHQASAAKDYVFSQYYPVLRAAAPHSGPAFEK